MSKDFGGGLFSFFRRLLVPRKFLRDQLAALVRLQSEEGLWHTVLTDPGSYQETSGSAAIAAALLSRGNLYNKYVQKSIKGLLEQITEDGTAMSGKK